MKSGNTVSIIGTGDFGRALAKPLLRAGYEVLFGSRRPQSRNPAARDPALAEAKVCAIEEAIQASNVIFLAVHTSAQEQLKVFHHELQGKVLVDVSNVTKENTVVSNALRLQRIFPESHVVKAFNTLSAYTLMTGHSTASLDVYIAGDDAAAVQTVMDVARQMGFNAVARGKLSMAWELENMNVRLFTGWGSPLIVAGVITAVWSMYFTIRFHVIHNADWEMFPMSTLSKVQGAVSITLLSMCYLPGNIAAFIQLINGTKHKPFPTFLDRWLKMRKQLGLLALWLAALHCIMSLLTLTPGYNSRYFIVPGVTVPVNQTEDLSIKLGSRMHWLGECVVLFGALALAFMSILGVTSLPSVGASMNWKQWTFVQSYLGYFCLALAAAHGSFITCPSWSFRPFSDLIRDTEFLGVLLPYFTLFLRLLLLFPCLSIPLMKIRQGWERGINNDMEAGTESMNGYNNPNFVERTSSIELF